MNLSIKLIIFILIIITTIGAKHTAIKDGQFRCKNYMLNSYLYLLLAVLIISLNVVMMDENNLVDKMRSTNMFGTLSVSAFVLTFVLLFCLLMIDPRNILMKHIVWLLMLVMFGFMVYPSYLNQKYQGTIVRSLLGVIGIMIGFSMLIFFFPNMFLENYSFFGAFFLILLIGAIFMQISTYFIKDTVYNKFVTYAIIVLFAFLISFDTQTLVIRSKTCNEKSKTRTFLPDYIDASMSLLLDMINIYNTYK